jgi:Rieske Fe-S protein
MNQSPTRRHFLQVLSGSAAVIGCSALGCGTVGPSGMIAAGNVSDLATPSITAISGESVAIARDEKGLYAMTLICPHEECDMESDGAITTSSITCTCHGSRFDANGAVVQGPANTPLDHFVVTVDSAGAITINADVKVDASTRTVVKAS